MNIARHTTARAIHRRRSFARLAASGDNGALITSEPASEVALGSGRHSDWATSAMRATVRFHSNCPFSIAGLVPI